MGKKILYVRPPGMPLDFEPLLLEAFGIPVIPTESYNEAVALNRLRPFQFFVICDRILQYTEQGEKGEYGDNSVRPVGLELAQHLASRFRMKRNKTEGERLIILFLSNDPSLLDAAGLVNNIHGFYKTKHSDGDHQSLQEYLGHFGEQRRASGIVVATGQADFGDAIPAPEPVAADEPAGNAAPEEASDPDRSESLIDRLAGRVKRSLKKKPRAR